MTESESGDPTPGDAQTAESTESETDPSPDPTPEEVRQTIKDRRHDLSAAHAKAMDRLSDEYDVEHERDLYERLGFAGEGVTIEIDVFDAELYILVDVLEKIAASNDLAHRRVPMTRLLDDVLEELVEEVPAETIDSWIGTDVDEQLAASQLPVDGPTEAADD